MRLRIYVVLCCFFMTGANAAVPQEFTGREYAEAMLLLSPSDFDVKLAAKSLRRLSSDRQNIMDLLAEVTWSACSGNRKMDPDTLSWLAKTLGTTKQARYAELLDYCLSNTTDLKIIKYLKQARDSLEGTTPHSFVGGKMDLGQLHARLTKKGSATSHSLVARQFDELRRGQPLDDVYAVFGAPNSVRGVNVPGNKVGYRVTVRVSEDMIAFDYSDLGTIRFAHDENKASWLVDGAKSENGLFWNTQAGRFGTFNDLITSGGEADLHLVLNRLSRQQDLDRVTLDQVAARIYRSRQEKSDEMADVLAHLCHVIEKTRDGRYKQVLLDVADTAETRTLRKHAAKAAKRLPDTTEEKYVPAPG